MGVPLRVLIVEDSEIDFLFLAQELRRGGYDPVCERVETGELMSAALDRETWDVILIDYTLPRFSGIAALELINRKHIDLPAIIVSGTIDEETAVAAMKAGAHDYIMKNNLPRLIPAIEREMRETKGRQERRRIEKALQETEKKFFTVFQHSPVPMAIASIEDGRLFDVNEQYTRLMEFSQEELIGHTTVELNLWADPEERKKYIQSIERNRGKIQSYPVSVRTKSGNVIKVFFSADIIKINNAHYLLSSAVDITDRLNAEEILKTQAHILDSMAEGVSLADEKGFITFTNPAYDTIFGYERGELLGQHVSLLDTGSPADNIQLSNEIRQELQSKGTWSGEFANRKKDGTLLATLAHISALEVSGKQFRVTVQENITDRKQAEKMLRESEELYRSLASTADSMYLVDRDCRYLFLNEGYLRRFGLPKDKIIGRQYGEFHTEEDAKTFADYVTRVFETGDSFQSERRSASDGRQFIRTFSPVRDPDGTTTAITIAAKDITQRKRAEEELRVSEIRYRELFGNMGSGVSVYQTPDNGENFIFKDYNAAAERIDNTPRGQVIGRSVIDVFPGVKDYGLFDVFRRVYRTGKSERHPVTFYNDKKISGWRENYVYKLPSGEIVSVFEDITERKQAEAEILWKTAFLEAEVEASGDGILVVDENNNNILTNRTFLDLMEVPQHIRDNQDNVPLLQHCVTRMVHPDRGIEKIRYLYSHPNEKSYDESELKSGIFLERYSSPVLGKNGEYYGRIWRFHDITEHKKAAKEIESVNRQLRAFAGRLQAVREEERTRIAREIHDELGGALTSLKIDFSLLKRTAAKVRDTILRDSLHDGMGDMTNLIDATMRTVRRIATELRPGILDDLGLVAALEWQLSDFQKRTGIACEFLSSSEHIDLEEKDATALFRIVQETLTNVARYSGANTVHVNLHATADAFRLVVEDNGKGIREEEIRNPKSLGLLGVRERAILFGGRVTVTGRPDRGTTVTVEGPLAGKGRGSGIRRELTNDQGDCR